jgi:hypothetical protein
MPQFVEMFESLRWTLAAMYLCIVGGVCLLLVFHVTSITHSVTPAFLAPNKSPNKSCVFSKLSSRAQLPPSLSLPLTPARVPRIPPAPPAPGPAPTRAFPTLRSATVPGIPRTPRSRRPVRLAITAVPKITPTPGNHKTPQKPFPYFPNNFL